MKPKIKSATFGSITVGQKTFEHDVVIGLDGKVRKRKKKLSKRQFGTSHKISLDEIKDVYEKGARNLIVGSGQYDQVRLSADASRYLADRECKVTLLSTPNASKEWNKTDDPGGTIGLFHITC